MSSTTSTGASSPSLSRTSTETPAPEESPAPVGEHQTVSQCGRAGMSHAAKACGCAANHRRHCGSSGARAASSCAFGPLVLDSREGDAKGRRGSRSCRQSHRSRRQRNHALLRRGPDDPSGRKAVLEALPLHVHHKRRPGSRHRVSYPRSWQAPLPDHGLPLDLSADASEATRGCRAGGYRSEP
jgi:hypothetical protein